MTAPQKHEKSLLIRRNLEEIKLIAREVESWGTLHNWTQEAIYDVSLALEELVSNIIHHGFDDDRAHSIIIKFSLKGPELTVRITDFGKPFNPLEAPPPDLSHSVKERPLGGLWIHLARGTVDEIRYEREHEENRLTIRKRVS